MKREGQKKDDQPEEGNGLTLEVMKRRSGDNRNL